ncbi:MAG: phage holin family protein [Methanoregula sp.]|nr:phage holin family protein [Methanoregula sp.]
MEPDARDPEASVESEFAATARYLELYMRQKIDLYLQHYLFDPFTFLGTKLMYLAVVMALLASGTLILVGGIILLIATRMPLWASLLVTGVLTFIAGAIIAYVFFYKTIVLETPTATEMMNRGKT